MNRRAFLALSGGLATSGGLALSGCLRSDVGPARSRGDPTETEAGPAGSDDPSSDGLVVADVYPREVERTFFDYEYVELENVADTPLDATGYVLEYGGVTEYVVPDIEMEPGSQLIVASRSGQDTVLDSAPPIYLHFAGFGDGPGTSVLDGEGEVVLRDPGGALVERASYDATTPTDGS